MRCSCAIYMASGVCNLRVEETYTQQVLRRDTVETQLQLVLSTRGQSATCLFHLLCPEIAHACECILFVSSDGMKIRV